MLVLDTNAANTINDSDANTKDSDTSDNDKEK